MTMKKSDHNLQLGLGESIYDSSSEVSAQVAAGQHRAIVGSFWEELGDLQIKFLISQGLRPSHTLLDVGCGCLRLGVKAIPYLQRGNYFGIDNNASLLEAGMNVELQQIDLKEALPEERLFILPDFEFDKLEKKFDYLIAQSLFSHFTFNRIRRCLSRMIPLLHETSKIFATFFEVPAGQDPEKPLRHDAGGVISYSDKDPYHYLFSDLEFIAQELPLKIRYLGEWGHPRNQKMVLFELRK
jgi:hypothetical protein